MSKRRFNNWSHKALLMCSLVLGLTQVGCAHPIVVEPSVVVHSRMGHAPVYAQERVPVSVWVMPQPRVIYVPQVYGPAHGWKGQGAQRHAHRHDGRDGGYDRRHPSLDERGRGTWGGGHR